MRTIYLFSVLKLSCVHTIKYNSLSYVTATLTLTVTTLVTAIAVSVVLLCAAIIVIIIVAMKYRKARHTSAQHDTPVTNDNLPMAEQTDIRQPDVVYEPVDDLIEPQGEYLEPVRSTHRQAKEGTDDAEKAQPAYYNVAVTNENTYDSIDSHDIDTSTTVYTAVR